VKWLALLACLMLTTSAGARIDTPRDDSDPELVRLYIGLPCEALYLSTLFQFQEMGHIAEHLQTCHETADANPDFKYGKLMCMYIQIQGEVIYNHYKSAGKAYDMMCVGNVRKNPEYKIEF
jgi:hypothetical protein